MKKIHYLCMISVILVFLTGCSETDITDQMANIKNAKEEHVLSVKGGSPVGHPDMTFGEAFDNFFAYPTWQYFVGIQEGYDEDGDGKPDYTIDNVDVVEFTGYCTYQDVEVKARIQFTLAEDGDTFETTYLAFNEVPQNRLILYALLDKVFGVDDIGDTAEETDIVEDQAAGNVKKNDEDQSLQAFIDCICAHSDPPMLEGEELEEYFKNEYAGWLAGTGYTNVHMDEYGGFYWTETEDAVDYYDAYAQILGDVCGTYGEYCEYTVYDFDNDGVMELITSFGTCDADWANDVYTIDHGAVTMIGEFYGYVSFYGAEEGVGIYTVYGHMGHQTVEWLTKEGNELYGMTLLDEEVPDDDYYSNPYSIMTYSITDYSLLRQLQ